MKKNLEKSTSKLKMLAIIVEEFLETEVKKQDLLSNPDKIDQFKSLLEKNLWRGHPDDYRWTFALGPEEYWALTSDEDPSVWTDEAVRRETIKEGANTIVYHHRLLKSVWDKCKEKVEIFNEIRANADSESYNPNYVWELKHEGEIFEETDRMEIHGLLKFDYEKGRFYTENALIAFGDLLENVSANDLKVCKDETCNRWFVVTSKHERDYCSPKCAKKNAEMKQRRKDPKKYNEYHRKYYHEHISKKKIKEGTESISGD